MPKEPDTLTVSDPAPLSEAPVPTPPPAAPSQVAAAAPEALATGIARAQTDIVSDVIAPAKPAVEGTAAMDTPARKRGAGRAGPTKGRKGGARPAADTPEAKAAPSVEAPAFSSRRRGTVTDGATPPKPPQMPDPMVPPPPRPAGLPPVSELPEGTPPPPRPKIPPHLAKSVPGPKAALGSKPTTPKPAKTSRLAQLMTRLQNEPDGGAVGDTPPGKSTLPPIPDLPKTIDAKAPPRPAGPKPVVAPIHDLPLPKPPANAAKAAPDGKPADADLPDPGAASASLTPPRKASLGGPLPPPRGLSREGLDEAQAMTLFGARAEKKERSLTPVLVGIAVALLLAVAVWAGVLLLGRDPVTPANIDSSALAPAVSDPVVAALPPASAPELAPRAPLADAPDLAAPGEGSDAPRIGPPDSGPELAGNAPPGTVAPTPDPGLGPQETAQPLPAPATREEAVSRYAALGIWQIPPDPPILPETGRIDDLRLSGVSAPPELTPVNTLPAAIDLASLDVPQAMLPPAPLPAPPAVAEADTAPEVTTAAIASETASPEVAAPQPEVPAESIRVVAGAPSVTPPARPTRPARLRDIVPVNPADGPTLRPVQRPGSDAALDAATTTTAVASLVPETDETGLTPLVPVNEGDPALRPRGRRWRKPPPRPPRTMPRRRPARWPGPRPWPAPKTTWAAPQS